MLNTDSKRGVAEGPQIVVVELIVEAGGSEPHSRLVLDEGPQVMTAQWTADSAELRRQGAQAATWSIVGTGGDRRRLPTALARHSLRTGGARAFGRSGPRLIRGGRAESRELRLSEPERPR